MSGHKIIDGLNEILAGESRTFVGRLGGFTPVCEVPTALGPVTKLRDQGGRITAETESGVTLIVPVTKP